jgi:hypothetical protein
MIHVDEEGLRGEVRVLNPMASEGPRAEPLLELTFQAGRERVSLLWRGKGAIGEARTVLRGMELLAGKIEAERAGEEENPPEGWSEG